MRPKEAILSTRVGTWHRVDHLQSRLRGNEKQDPTVDVADTERGREIPVVSG